ncbi:MAG: Mut7-C ubiquitin/RNAse domain-containing protein [Bacteroidales bacterium]|jgi:hypothetical protein|nr:Mut7-C ubiquitin/RNAse domain-containing protein [Bacteroidales bacterium]
MNIAFIRFYEELNDFLPPLKRKVVYPVHFKDSPSIKSIIESEGIPHTEVDLILINGNAVSFKEKVNPDDQISVYPVFESFDISPINVIRLKPLRDPKFVLDVHLGKLARYLRMLGFDSVYDYRYNTDEILRISILEKRAILTRNRKLLMKKELEMGYWVRSEMSFNQVSEIIQRFDLKNQIRLFSICTICNGRLQPVEKETVMNQHPGFKFYPGTAFYQCNDCLHTFWYGTHCERFKNAVTERV